MNSRERVERILNRQEVDAVPLDMGGSLMTGMHVSSVYRLRQALRLDAPGVPVKIIEPYQMLGELQPDLLDALGADVVSLAGRHDLGIMRLDAGGLIGAARHGRREALCCPIKSDRS